MRYIRSTAGLRLRIQSWFQSSVWLLYLALVAVPLGLPAQVTHRDVIRGRVTKDSAGATAGTIAEAIADAQVILTKAPDRSSQVTKTDSSGRYEIVVDQGTGDYLLHIAAPGRQTIRRRITRDGTDSVFVVNVVLAVASVQQLAPVAVQAVSIRPERAPGFSTGVGSAERFADAVTGAIPPEQAGDLTAIAATVPGIVVTANGVAAAGLSPSQNSTTLNGLAFGGAEIPRDARMRVRVSTSTYDPARGWFSGLQENVELGPGTLYSFQHAHLTVDAPALQFDDLASAQAGNRFTGVQASTGGYGPFADDQMVYNYAVQGRRHVSDAISIADAAPDLLRRAGVSQDSVARFLGLVSAAGVPLRASNSPASRVSDNASFIARIDHAPYDWKTLDDAKRTWGILAYGSISNNDAIDLSPTSTAAHAGTASTQIASAQVSYSSYFHANSLTTARSALSVTHSHADPYLLLPNAEVRVTSLFPDETGGVTSLAFGGNAPLIGDLRQWTWETTSETQFTTLRRAAHRVTLTADSRLDGIRQDANPNPAGTFMFNSLGDLAANQPTSFTRTLNTPTQTSGEWNGFVALGDLWRKSQTFQLLYGARLEANRFTSAPPNNPTVDSLFGLRTDHVPNTVHLSPRIGFTWVLRDARSGFSDNKLGQFTIGPTRYLRGGIGEFRNLLTPALITNASIATGLPTGVRTLTCVGLAAPSPAWTQYLADQGSIPQDCLNTGQPAAFRDVAPAVELFDPSYTAPRSWRGNLAFSSSYRNLVYSLEGVYSLNLNQPDETDVNFNNTPRFTLADEGRPVFVSPASIVARTGTVATTESRRSSGFGRVVNNLSTSQSDTRQATITVSPDLTAVSNWFLSAAYTLSSTRSRLSGFAGTTFSSPIDRTLARADFDARHQLRLQGGYSSGRVTLTFFGRLQSGFPFTPLVGNDVNGDGLVNDRAFIFDPATAHDTALASATSVLLASASGKLRSCLARQFGHAAGRNSCEGPWTASLNAQAALATKVPGTDRDVTVALFFQNPLSGLDQLLHRGENLHGWGTPAPPDPILYNVSGFDPIARRFRYEVNPRFGSTRPSNTPFRTPFRITLDVSFNLGTPVPRQQLDRWLQPGRAGHPGPRLSAAEIKRRYQKNVPDPYAAILQESDSLLLTRDQAAALQQAQARYRQQMDIVWTSVAEYLAGVGDHYSTAELLQRTERTTDEAWELTRQDVHSVLPSVLSDVQLRLLPWPANKLRAAKDPVTFRQYWYTP